MLKHEDHIFSNLNGYNSFKLKDAKSRGCWSDTKKIIERGSDWIIEEIRLTITNITEVNGSIFIDQLTLKSPELIQLKINLLLE